MVKAVQASFCVINFVLINRKETVPFIGSSLLYKQQGLNRTISPVITHTRICIFRIKRNHTMTYLSLFLGSHNETTRTRV